MDSTGTIDAESDVRIEADYRAQGASLLQQGRFTDAATNLQRAVESDPGDSSAWRLLGGALASSGDFAGAVPAFEQAIHSAPTDARNFYNLGVALQGVNRESEARSAFESSIRIDPGYQQARARLEAMNGTRLAGAADPTGIYRATPEPRTEMPGLGSIGFSSGSTPAPAPAPTPEAAPKAPIGLSAVGGHGGGMPGLGSLGAAPTPAPEASPSISPSQGTPTLRQPAASPAPYIPSQSYGGTSSGYAPNPVLGLRPDTFGNTSGTNGDVPPEVSGGFNFGAALISFWWLRNHNLRPLSIGLAIVYAGLRALGNISGSWIAFVILLLIQTGMFFALGFMGNRIAWQNRRFDDIADFKACQKIWMYWAIPLAALQVCAFIAIFTGAFFVAANGTHHH